MTNPDNAIGTNGAYNGRTSVEAFNDNLNIYSSSGAISGWKCQPQSGMTVKLGGVSGTKDVAVAVDNSGNKTIILNRLGSAVPVTLAAASTTSNMVDFIVAYVNNPANVPTGGTAMADNPSICGIIPVRGSAATAPTVSQIRAAITADGGTGSTAYYVILARIDVTKNITTITSSNIIQGPKATLNSYAIANNSITSDNIDWTTIKKIKTSTSGSISLEAGSWLLAYEAQVNQVSVSSSAVLVTKFSSKSGLGTITWAVPSATSQNVYNSIVKFSSITLSSTSSITRTQPTKTNANVSQEMFIAIPILGS